MFLTRPERYGRAENVAGFDACELSPLIVAQIGERSRALLPRIPDNGGCGVLLLCADGATKGWIDQLRSAVGVEVRIVGGCIEDHIAGLKLLAIGIGIIEIRDLIKAMHAHTLRIANPEVSMQRLFKAQRRRSDIARSQFKPKRFTDGDAMYQAKFVRP